MIGFLGCRCTLSAHLELPNSPRSFSSGLLSIHAMLSHLEFAPAQVQDLGLVELHVFSMRTPFKPVKVPLDGSPSLLIHQIKFLW